MGEIISPRFERSLKDYENKRYQELKVLYKKMTGYDYDGKMIENGWGLADIACSSGRYKKYQSGFQKAYQERRKREIEKEELEVEKLKKSTSEAYKKELEEEFVEISIEDMIEGLKRLRDFVEIIEVSGSNYKEDVEGIRISEIKEENQDENGVDMEKAKEQFQSCLKLMKGRNKKYGNSWKKLRLGSIVDLMIMKLDRCQKQELDNEAMEVELEDIVNYGIFGLMNIRNK